MSIILLGLIGMPKIIVDSCTEDFAKILPSAEANVILERLRAGESVHVPGTTLERFRVGRSRSHYIDIPHPQRPKEPPKPKIDAEAVREHHPASHHAIIAALESEVAILKKWLRDKEISGDQALDEFSETVEASWK
jgi:hypothetical protein